MSKEFVMDIISLDEDQFLEKYQRMPYEEFKKCVRLALLEQDRDTRHAITNTVTVEDCISDQAEKDRVCGLIMNCNAGCQIPS